MFEPISIEVFEGRTGIVPHLATQATKIVSLRDLMRGTVTAVIVMPMSYLEKLLRSITLEGDKECRPYENCELQQLNMDPNHLVMGQTFVQRNKYQGLLENFNNFLGIDFCVSRGIAQRTALIIYGTSRTGELVMAHYVPPIIELSSEGYFLLDGTHRNFLVRQVGTTIESVLLKGVSIPLPCGVGTWNEISVVDDKPPREERFRDLEPSLFRDLKWIGVDG